MTRSYRYLHYDVFTDHLFGGNQLAVVLDGRGLSGETMQAIAKEMNFSETTFMLPSEKAGTDVRMRIFTPGDELPTVRVRLRHRSGAGDADLEG
jgi:trans-2,3-dihydro-3-hydroxyanthranilate isomerase